MKHSAAMNLCANYQSVNPGENLFICARIQSKTKAAQISRSHVYKRRRAASACVRRHVDVCRVTCGRLAGPCFKGEAAKMRSLPPPVLTRTPPPRVPVCHMIFFLFCFSFANVARCLSETGLRWSLLAEESAPRPRTQTHTNTHTLLVTP